MKYKCPFCNKDTVTPHLMDPDFPEEGLYAECYNCLSSGPLRDTEKEAMSVFCDPPYRQKPKSACWTVV